MNKRYNRVTVNEFVKKYGIPYTMAYEASFSAPCESTRIRREYKREFEEQELKAVVQAALERRISKYQELMDRYTQMRDRLLGE